MLILLAVVWIENQLLELVNSWVRLLFRGLLADRLALHNQQLKLNMLLPLAVVLNFYG